MLGTRDEDYWRRNATKHARDSRPDHDDDDADAPGPAAPRRGSKRASSASTAVPAAKQPRTSSGSKRRASSPAASQPKRVWHRSRDKRAAAGSKSAPPPADEYSYSYSDGDEDQGVPSGVEPADDRGTMSLHDVDLHSALALQFRNMAHALRSLPQGDRVHWAEAVAKAMEE